MAITGSGTQADPWIVHDWSEFLVICNDGDRVASQYTKFANPDRAITGSGTQQSPFIVSTFEEMLEKTHASYIYQVELINAETKLYHYNGIYCTYDDSITTIDYNNVPAVEKPSTLYIRTNTDFNGWTILNFTKDTDNSEYINVSPSSSSGVLIKNLITKNMYITGITNTLLAGYASYSTLETSIIGLVTNGNTINNLTKLGSIGLINNCSISHTAYGSGFICGDSSLKIKNTYLHFEAPNLTVGLGFYYDVSTCYVDGVINANGTTPFGDDVRDVIFNAETNVFTKQNYCLSTVAVNDDKLDDSIKADWSDSNIIHAQDETEILSPTWLHNNGFPIGVD